jgi:hypothetical protein
MGDVASVSSPDLFFEPELLGVVASQYRSFAALILLPTLGFVFLYLLGRPLTKLPFIETDSDYSPPRWVLPVFAIGALFATSFSLSIGFFLTRFTTGPSDVEFLRSYHKTRNIDLQSTRETIKGAHVLITAYDGASNFYIYVNGYHVFSSEVNCLMKYQCKPIIQDNTDAAFVNASRIVDYSLRHIHQLYPLPHTGSILGFLIEGTNYVDIVSGNSGRGNCDLAVSVNIEFNTFTSINAVHITPEMGSSSLTQTDNQGTLEIFNSGDKNLSPSDNNNIDPYLTLIAEGSYRLCERIRFKLDLNSRSLPTQLTDIKQWTKWVEDRAIASNKEIRNQKPYDQITENR